LPRAEPPPRPRESPIFTVACPSTPADLLGRGVRLSRVAEQSIDLALRGRSGPVTCVQHSPQEVVHRDHRARVRRSVRAHWATARAIIDRIVFKSVFPIVINTKAPITFCRQAVIVDARVPPFTR